MIERKSTKEYWDDNWKRAGSGIGSAVRKNLFWHKLDLAFIEAFSEIKCEKSRLIEVGAGASEWLPRLNKDFLFEVSGLDYSQEGCDRARTILEKSGVKGEIYFGDMFSPPKDLVGKFDVACSFGLVEHFTDTAEAVRACASFVRPGGIILTLIPNMSGLNGFFYKLFNRQVFDTHVPLNLDQLVQAHIDAGLKPYFSRYLMGFSGVIDNTRYEPVTWRRYLRKLSYLLTQLIWALESKGWGVPENKVTSPYMICVAKVS